MKETRYCVKIVAGSQRALAECVYFRKDLHPDLFHRWLWYFKYRAALLQVQNPKHYIDLQTNGYDYIPPAEEQVKILKDKIAGKKRVITQNENTLQKFRDHWAELFPYEDDPDYKKALTKVASRKTELLQLEQELKALLEPGQ